MPAMTWTPEMSVGVPELDEDHKGLIRIINQLGEAAGDGTRQAAVRQCLMGLMRYAETHFAREEQVMAACGFPKLEPHRGKHQDFITRIQEATTRFDQDPDKMAQPIAEEMLDYLTKWLTRHIMVEDMSYRPFAEQKLPEARKAAQSFRASEVWRG